MKILANQISDQVADLTTILEALAAVRKNQASVFERLSLAASNEEEQAHYWQQSVECHAFADGILEALEVMLEYEPMRLTIAA